MRVLWRHNLACATIAEQLASTGFLDGDIAFTSGVMHDIGRLALAVVRPRVYTELLGEHAGPPESIQEAERETFGRDHCEMGRQLVADWKLPEDFEPIVAGHHAPREPNAPWGTAELIHVSCRMADAAGFAALPACQAGSFAELVQMLPARERGLFYPDIETLTAEISRKISAIEAI